MWKPHRLGVRGAFSFGARIHTSQVEGFCAAPTQGREVRGFYREQRALIDRLIKQTITRDAFELQSGDKCRPRYVLGLFRKVLEHISIGRNPSDSGIRL